MVPYVHQRQVPSALPCSEGTPEAMTGSLAIQGILLGPATAVTPTRDDVRSVRLVQLVDDGDDRIGGP